MCVTTITCVTVKDKEAMNLRRNEEEGWRGVRGRRHDEIILIKIEKN